MYAEILDKQIYYEITSNRPTQRGALVLVHGWGTSIEAYQQFINLISKTIKVYALDLPGFGKSALPEKDWGTKEYTTVVTKFIENVVLKGGRKKTKVILFGHSFGGAISARLAAQHPEYVEKVILCAPAIIRIPKISRIKIPIWIKDLFRTSWVRRLYYRVFHRRSDMPFRLDLDSNFKKVITEDSSSFLSTIKAPTLLIWGKKDTATPFKDAEVIAQNIKDIIRMFNDFDHYMPKKNARYLWKVSRDFIIDNTSKDS